MRNNSVVRALYQNTSFLFKLDNTVAIDFSQNVLTKNIPRIDSRKLRLLNISHNSFKMIPEQLVKESHFPFLQTIDLSWNQIAVVKKKTFSYLTKLANVFLNHNEIVLIENGAFPPSYSIDFLDLSENNLSLIKMEELPPIHPHLHVDTSGNPLKCDCDLQFFQNMFPVFTSAVNCVSPFESGFESNNLSLADAVLNGEECESLMCSPPNPFLIAYEDDVNLILPCPLNVTRFDEIVWTLPSGMTLSIATSTWSEHRVFVTAEGSLNFSAVAGEMSGKYLCSAPHLGAYLDYPLHLAVAKRGRSVTQNISIAASLWKGRAHCGRHSPIDNQKDQESIFFPTFAIILLSILCVIVSSTLAIVICCRMKQTSSMENESDGNGCQIMPTVRTEIR
nr:leucine-rich repeat-containing protein 4B-like [Lytechinus pictus]